MKTRKEQVIGFIADVIIFAVVLALSDLIMNLLGLEGFWIHLLCVLVLYLPINGAYEAITMRIARKNAKIEMKQETE